VLVNRSLQGVGRDDEEKNCKYRRTIKIFSMYVSLLALLFVVALLIIVSERRPLSNFKMCSEYLSAQRGSIIFFSGFCLSHANVLLHGK
jgi:uncharacterized membrane protein